MSITIRPYEPARDADAAYALWQQTVGDPWPLTPHRLIALLHDPAAAGHWLATDGARVVGLAAMHWDSEDAATATLTALFVAPDRQCQGLGTALHAAALDTLRERGVRRVRLGAGDVHVWIGVPDNLRAVLPFFAARGWTFTETTYDLTQDLTRYRIPPAVITRVADTVRVDVAATERDIDDLFAFVGREFPNWLAEYRAIRDLGATQDFLIGRDAAGAVIASLIMFSPQSDQTRGDTTWSLLLGEEMGSLGCVGVAAAMQERGIGAALVGRGSEIVRGRGARNCHIHWTTVPAFYEKLGYRIWHSFAMAHREL